MQGEAIEVEVLRKAVKGMRPWGYMQGEAMEVEVPKSAIEVEVLKRAVMGRRPWRYMQEEVRRREGRTKMEEEVGLHLKSNKPSLTRWGITPWPP